MVARRHDLPLVEHEDHRRVADGAEAVRDDQHGPAGDEQAERILHRGLALGVERAGGLVEDEDRRGAQEGAGDGDALLLAAGEQGAAFTDDGVVALRQVDDELVRVRVAGGGQDSFARRRGVAEQQVVKDGVVEEHRFLRDEGDVAPQVGEAHLAHINPVNGDAAGGDLEETRHEVGEGALARAARADERADGAGGDGGGDMAEGGCLAVGEGDVVEGDVAAQALDGRGRGRVGDRHRLVEDVFEA